MSTQQQALSRRYIFYKIFTNLWFVSAVWLYFYRIFITDQQVGILDGIAFAIGLIAEVPSGALADKFGRDKLVRLGQALAGCGILFQAFSSGLPNFILGQAVMMIGVSFVSGADDALFYENLKFDVNSAAWRKLVTRGSQVALIGTLFATITGGYLHSLDPKIPWILNGLAFLFTTVLIWPVRDTRPRKERQKFLPELVDYLQDIKSGFGQFRRPQLWLYVPYIITVQGLFYTAGYGLLRLVLLDRFGFDPLLGSVAIASSSLISVGFLAYLHRQADSVGEKQVLSTIAIMTATALLASLFNIGLWGYFVILILYVGEHVLYPIISEVINKKAKEEQRATVLSVASFLKTLPYIFLAPVIGYLSTINRLDYFLIIWATLIILATTLYLVLRRRNTKVSLVE